jgi:hypothetical protein
MLYNILQSKSINISKDFSEVLLSHSSDLLNSKKGIVGLCYSWLERSTDQKLLLGIVI